MRQCADARQKVTDLNKNFRQNSCWNADSNGIEEISYRKQIARQLRTQYVEGIYRPKYYTVTLKSRLGVTQGHW